MAADLALLRAQLARGLLRRVNNSGLTVIVSLALVMASYRAASALDVSGPIAVVARDWSSATAARRPNARVTEERWSSSGCCCMLRGDQGENARQSG